MTDDDREAFDLLFRYLCSHPDKRMALTYTEAWKVKKRTADRRESIEDRLDAIADQAFEFARHFKDVADEVRARLEQIEQLLGLTFIQDDGCPIYPRSRHGLNLEADPRFLNVLTRLHLIEEKLATITPNPE